MNTARTLLTLTGSLATSLAAFAQTTTPADKSREQDQAETQNEQQPDPAISEDDAVSLDELRCVVEKRKHQQ